MSPFSHDTLSWLLEGDPAIRWQTQRDLLHESPEIWSAERERVTDSGWGAQLLSCRDEDGRWGGGIYAPKWTSTTYTLLLLKDMGLPGEHPAGREGAKIALDGELGSFWNSKFQSRLEREDLCITGMMLSLGSYFGLHDERLEALVAWLLTSVMADGAWNCRHQRGATHSSFHTTFNVLDGLQDYLEFGPGHRVEAIVTARDAALEFMLQHGMFRSDKTGEIIKDKFLKLSYPPRWHYDVLRGLDFFRRIEAPRDTRLAESIEVLAAKCDGSGRWRLENRYEGQVFFQLESLGKPSRWNTLRVLRVLNWWRDTNFSSS